jgi:hypothetical protein
VTGRSVGARPEMRIVIALGLLAVLAAGCVSSGTGGPSPASDQPSPQASAPASTAPSLAPTTPTPPPTPTPTPVTTPTATPGPVPLAEIWPAGTEVVTVTDDLRVRSLPEVSDASIKYEPLLQIGTLLVVREGPVAASRYWWYRIEIPSSTNVALGNGIRVGWVAAANHDGTPWLGSSLWPTVARSGIAMTATLEHGNTGFDGVSLRISGLTSGESVPLLAAGEYSVQWACGTAPPPCGELGCGPASWELLKGSVTFNATAAADRAGVATTRLDFRAPAPAKPCPADPAAGWDIVWQAWALTITDTGHGLTLKSERFEEGVTY